MLKKSTLCKVLSKTGIGQVFFSQLHFVGQGWSQCFSCLFLGRNITEIWKISRRAYVLYGKLMIFVAMILADLYNEHHGTRTNWIDLEKRSKASCTWVAAILTNARFYSCNISVRVFCYSQMWINTTVHLC